MSLNTCRSLALAHLSRLTFIDGRHFPDPFCFCLAPVGQAMANTRPAALPTSSTPQLGVAAATFHPQLLPTLTGARKEAAAAYLRRADVWEKQQGSSACCCGRVIIALSSV